MKKKMSYTKLKKQAASVLLAAAMLTAIPGAGLAAFENSVSAQTFSEAAQDMFSVVNPPTVNVTPGLYRSAQQIVLTAEDGAEIYYTTNRLMPDETDTRYTTPITIDQDTNLCAVAIKDGVKSAPVTYGYLIRSQETPDIQFMVMSDVEIGEGLETPGGNLESVRKLDYPRINKAMEVTKGIFNNPDLLVMNGDIVKCNSGKPDKSADHASFITLMQEAMAANQLNQTPVQVTIGNHDALNHSVTTMKSYYDEAKTDWFPASTNGYYHKELKGYHFFYLNSNTTASDQTQWLTEELAKISDPSAPIFIFMHIPIEGSLDDKLWCYNSAWIKDLLKNYPQAMVFSGHTHKTIAEDRSIGQNLGFTAINEGTLTYAESTEHDILSYDNKGNTVAMYQFPVTQCAAVEVYSDRIEVNRITINGDFGNAKDNGYIPVEPYFNSGFTSGEKWVIRRGKTAQEWKDNFSYTPEQRRENAPVPSFPDNAKVILTKSGSRTATITLPQAEIPENVHYYKIDLLAKSGKIEKSVKLNSQRNFSPMHKTLTYSASGLAPGTEYTAKVTAYNEYGVGSSSITSANAITTDDIPGVKAKALVNENLDTAETDVTTHAVPYISSWNDGKGSISYENNNAMFIGGDTTTNCDMRIPFQPQSSEDHAFQPLLGEFFLEYEYQMMEGMQDGAAYLQSADGNVMQMLFSSNGKTITLKPSGESGGWASAYATANADFKTSPVKLKYRFGTDENGKQYIRGFWVNDRLIREDKVSVGVKSSPLGWKQIAFARNQQSVNEIGSQFCAVDNFKVWLTTQTQIQNILDQEDNNLSFEQIKGENQSPDNVTQNLELNTLISTQTASGLVITGWLSDKEDIIQPDGTVNRPLSEPVRVTLKPLLGMVDTMGETVEDYVTLPGKSITVTVTDLGQEPLNVAVTKDLSHQDFTEAYSGTNDEHAKVILPFASNYASGGILGTSVMAYTGGADGKATWSSSGIKGGQEFGIPFQPGAVLGTNPDKNNQTTCQAVPLNGEFVFEFDVTFLDNLPGGLWFYLRNGAGKNSARLDLSKNHVSIRYYNQSNTLTELAKKTLSSNSTHTIRIVLGTEGSTPYLNGLWIDDEAVTTKKQLIDSPNCQSDKGWTLLQATSEKNLTTAGDFCSIDNIRCYRSAEDQAKELAAAEEGKISFEQIQGKNTDPGAVTSNLELKSGESGRLLTANKLLVMGWESDKPSVIAADGTVTLPETKDTVVSLTPILAIRNAETGKYVTTKGSAIQVTVLKKQDSLDVAVTGYIAREDYSTLYTGSNEDHAKTILPHGVARSGGGIQVDYSGGAVTLKNIIEGKGFDFYIPFSPGTVKEDNGKYTSPVLSGEFTYEFDLNMLENAKSQGLWIYLQGQNGTNLARMVLTSSSIDLKYYKDGSSNLTSVSSFRISGDTHHFKFVLGTGTDGVPYISDASIDEKSLMGGNTILKNTGFSGGWMRMVAVSGNNWKAGNYCSIDNISCYRSAEDQAKELASAEEGKISFEQIQGKNTDPNTVTSNLELKSGESGRLLTANKLLVMGWESDNPSVIAADGTVTLPKVGKSERVILTPSLAIRNAETGKYITVSGHPITVTVKGKALGFADINGNYISVLDQNVAKGIADISNFSGSVHTVAALYNGSYLEQVWVGNPVNAENQTFAEVSINNLPENLTGKTLKLFVWNSDSLMPLYAPEQLNSAK